jgi:hypothetical protein
LDPNGEVACTLAYFKEDFTVLTLEGIPGKGFKGCRVRKKMQEVKSSAFTMPGTWHQGLLWQTWIYESHSRTFRRN